MTVIITYTKENRVSCLFSPTKSILDINKYTLNLLVRIPIHDFLCFAIYGCCHLCYIWIKWYSQLSKITIPHTIPSPSTGWTNQPRNKVHIRNLNSQQIIPYVNNHVFYIHYYLLHPYTKVTGCLFVFVFVFRRISLTAKPIGFSLTG